jgi:phage-related protein
MATTTNFKIYPWNGSLSYNKFDVVFEQAGTFRYFYATQNSVGQNPTGVYNFPITSYKREDDATILYYTYSGSGPLFAIGSIIRVTGMTDTSLNYTGMAIDAGSGWVKYPDDGWPITLAATVGAINCPNPAWTTGFMFVPSYSTTVETTQNIIKAQFGDGYSQRQRGGLNNNTQSWKLSFNERSDKEAKAIFNYIEERGGVDPINLLMPITKFQNRYDNKYTLKSPQLNTAYFDLNNISVIADQVFDI